MGIFKRHRTVFKAMAKVAIDDSLPEGAAPDLASVKAVMMANGFTDDAASAAIAAAMTDGVIELGENECALS